MFCFVIPRWPFPGLSPPIIHVLVTSAAEVGFLPLGPLSSVGPPSVLPLLLFFSLFLCCGFNNLKSRVRPVLLSFTAYRDDGDTLSGILTVVLHSPLQGGIKGGCEPRRVRAEGELRAELRGFRILLEKSILS